jgi:hypothetical protein
MAGRDGEEPKEGVDFKWVKDPNSNAKVRKFFTRAEKAEMAKPKAAAPKAPAAKPKASAPKAKAMETPRPKARQKGRGDGMIEATRRKVESAFGTGPKQGRSEGKPSAMTTAPTRQNMAPAPALKAAGSSRKEANQPSAPSNSRRKDEAGASQTVSFKEWQNMTRAERQRAGLPVSDIGGQLGFNRFMAGITGRQKTMKRN